MTPARSRRPTLAAALAPLALLALVTLPAPAQRLFRSDTALNVTITTDLKSFIRERDSLKLAPHPAVLSYVDSGGATVKLPVTVKARGHYRRQSRNCDFPPVWLNFKTDSVRRSLLGGLKKLKITTNCRPGNNEYEQYILQEYLLYRAFATLTDASPRTRLARITYADALGKEKPITTWAFFWEDMDDVAIRMHRKVFTATGALFDDVEQEPLRIISVFEYFAGNTDWSVNAQHNIALLADTTMRILPVAFDWDFSGAVDARYAVTDAQLRIRRVTDRLYRGVCMKPEEFKATIDLFRSRRAAIDGLFAAVPQISPDRVKRMQGFFNDFWKSTDNPKNLQRDFADDCQKIGN
ncbi:MAG TPA: hypothetical protein VIH11_05560 [Gemmatimonadaceae bacterium]|nr:hypothetical protein [Gemmatimonadaceae bacterium]